MAVKISKILFATDFSESANHALSYAVDLMKKYNAKLLILHVIEPIITPVDFAWGTYNYPDIEKQVREFAEEKMKTLVFESLPDGCQCETEIILGKPWREVVTYSRENSIDLIVLASHGQSGISHAIFGSTAEKIIRKSSCPVFTIKHPEAEYERP